jgi:hypothetical protein
VPLQSILCMLILLAASCRYSPSCHPQKPNTLAHRRSIQPAGRQAQQTLSKLVADTYFGGHAVKRGLGRQPPYVSGRSRRAYLVGLQVIKQLSNCSSPKPGHTAGGRQWASRPQARGPAALPTDEPAQRASARGGKDVGCDFQNF